MKKYLLSSLLVILLTACVSRESVFSTLQGNTGLIAYLGVDGNVYVSDQGGGNVTQLTKDASNQSGSGVVYQLPTWAMDGKQLAFIRNSGSSSNLTSNIMVADVANDNVKEVYKSTSEHPFYMFWTPDETNISFLSTAATSGMLILQSVPAKGGDRTIIDTGSPYYWSWAPDGKTLIIHSGGTSTSTMPDHLAFIRIQDTGVVEDGLDTTPASFQAPAWSPDGSHIALVRLQDGKKELILTDGKGRYEQTVDTIINSYSAFSWSINSDKLAYIDGTLTQLNAGVIGDLKIMDITTSKKTSTDAKNVFAYFWSPLGDKIIYFVPVVGNSSGNSGSSSNNQQVFLQTFLMDVSTGKSTELFTFLPTQEFFSILPYFDQYQQSNTIWSPDGQKLVLSFIDQNGNSGIAVVNLSGQQPDTKLIGDGVLAFWSWK